MFPRGAACVLTGVFGFIAPAPTRKTGRLRKVPPRMQLLLAAGIAAIQQLATSHQTDWRLSAAITIVLAESIIIGFLLTQLSKRRMLETERDKAHSALRESEAKNRAILSALPDLMFVLDEEGTYLDWYAADANVLYVPPEQFLGKRMIEILPPALAETIGEAFRQVVASGQPATVEYNLAINNEVRHFESRIVKCGSSKLLSIIRDVTDKKQIESELQHLLSHLLTLQEDERKRIARELHDNTAQNLFAITINLENLQQQNAGLASTTIELVRECQQLCEDSLREVRTLSYLIHPPALDRVGLIPTLRWYIDGFVRRSGISVQLNVDQQLERLPLDMEIDLFRVVQEGLSNVLRHSGSEMATVSLERRGDLLILEIRDNGRGIMHESARSNGTERFGIGIPSMRERLRRFGGHLDVKSAADGVTLVAEVPLPEEGRKRESVTG